MEGEVKRAYGLTVDQRSATQRRRTVVSRLRSQPDRHNNEYSARITGSHDEFDNGSHYASADSSERIQRYEDSSRRRAINSLGGKRQGA